MTKSTKKMRNLLFVLAIASTCALFYIFENKFHYEKVFEDVSSWGTFFTVYGVLYAILAGFLIIESINKYNALQSCIDDEINNIQDIRDLAKYLECDKVITNKIMRELLDYLNYVINNDWREMERGNKELDSDTSREMYEIYSAINKIKIESKKDEIALKILMGKMVEITTLRTKRISLSAQKMPDSLKLLMKTMSLVVVIGFLALGVHSIMAHIFMVASILASVLILHSIILDIDHPFDGTWNLSPEPYITLRNKMNRQAEEYYSSTTINKSKVETNDSCGTAVI